MEIVLCTNADKVRSVNGPNVNAWLNALAPSFHCVAEENLPCSFYLLAGELFCYAMPAHVVFQITIMGDY